MLAYFLQVNLCWLLFYGLYYVLLSRETFFRLNRLYLLVSMVSGLALPFLADWLSAATPLAAIAEETIVLPEFVVGIKTGSWSALGAAITEGGSQWSFWLL